MTHSFRDESSGYLGGPKERKKVMREILRLEAEELRKMQGGEGAGDEEGMNQYVSPYAALSHQQRLEEEELGGSTLPGLGRSRLTPSPFGGERGATPQLAHIEAISQPRARPSSTFTNYLRAPAALRKRGLRSPDVLFQPIGQQSNNSKPPRPTTITPTEPQSEQFADTFFMTQQQQDEHAATTDTTTTNTDKRVSILKSQQGGANNNKNLPGVEANAPHTTSTCNDGIFWVYGRHKVSQSTLGSTSSAASAKSPSLTEEQFKKLPLWQDICKKLASMIRDGSKRDKFGILFDLVSTGKVIAKGTSHLAGRLIYDYVENCRLELAITKLKFVFVGITDNVNCCAARDVFCLDDSVGGKYVGEFKRTFNALDGVHMFAVMPPAYSKWCDDTVKQLTRPAAAIKAEHEAKHQLDLQRQKQERNHKRNTTPPMRR